MEGSKENKTATIKKYQRGKTDTGSCEVQIALLTSRINELTEHSKIHPKDRHSRRGLIRMVEKRKKLLAYLESENPESYKKLIGQLELRK
ncbi:MAG: 30S ribosomal protein S15 [Candidatus Omnitrophica bacterium]|nr:30S ribosomal protein S15 [Candidatus Omnitrophota bacterium]